MADELSNIERQTLKRATGGWRADVTRFKEAVLILYSPFMGTELTPEQSTLITFRILQMLDELSVDPRIDDIAMRAIVQSHKVGLAIALRGSDRDELPNVAIATDSQRAVSGMAQRAIDSVKVSKKNLEDSAAVSTFEGLIGALKPVLDSPVQMERAVTWSLNNAKNSAITEVAAKTGEKITWVPERASCLHCAAYAGVTAGPEGFPKGLTFMEKPLKYKGFLKCPPLHPNCRCDVEIGLSVEYSEALKREAVREVLRGTSLDSVSNKAKIDAAKRLLENLPNDVPESVEKYARNAVKNNSFDGKKK